ncbi:methyl-accepting chemotaxis protein [Herbaspirillum chlorophenolicum]|uniref:Methyl-accepting chemotaxis protein n=1 Tax=Herbaspirillum chlorophenolicum TaxID=211589 RepID=A0ABW8F0I9_9BURK
MNWFANLKVSSKLVGGFLIVAFIGAVIGTMGILKAGQINGMATQMYEKEVVGLRHAAQANIDLSGASRAIRSAILSDTPEERDANLRDLDTRLARAASALTAAEQLFYTTEGKLLVENTRKAFLDYQSAIKDTEKQLRSESISDKRESTSQLFSVVRPLANTAEKMMVQMMEAKKSNADALNNETDIIYGNIKLLLIGLTMGGVLLGILIGLFISRSLTRQLGGEPKDVAAVAVAVSSGDLCTQIDTRNARAGSIVSAMHLMQTSLRKMVQAVRNSSESIATGSRQIATGNLDLSSRTEEQASSLEETASSMEELTSTVKQNVANARQANQMASESSSVALKGGEVVAEVVNTMGAINESSKKIVDIISVIDGIAFQTNILALNAAVEAARAGEQGRGFAVVASEVRNLAQRSAAAAKEIKVLIEDSVDKVEVGTRLADEAGVTMNEIVHNAQKVTDIIGEISLASQEQASGIEQINQAIIQMDDVTQQNAALVEEAAAASRSLQEQASSLAQIVSVFKLDETEIRQFDPAALPSSAGPRAVGEAGATRARALPRKIASIKEEEWAAF